MRQEPIPLYYNLRHVHRVASDAVPTKPMFKSWRMDTSDTYAAIFKADYGLTVIDDIVEDPAENFKIQSEI